MHVIANMLNTTDERTKEKIDLLIRALAAVPRWYVGAGEAVKNSDAEHLILLTEFQEALINTSQKKLQ